MVGLIGSLAAIFLGQGVPLPPDGVIARVNGEELSLSAFRDWVVSAHGWRHIDDYVDLELLRGEAIAHELPLPTATEVEAAFDQDWQDQILMRHGGNERSWIAELQKSGLDRAGYRDRRAGTLELEVVAKRVLKQQPMTPEQQRELWEREFGLDGMRTHVRVAFFNKLKDVVPGERVDAARMATLEAAAAVRAEAFLVTIRAQAAAFATEVTVQGDACTIPRFDSYPIDLRARGGEIARLRGDHFGGALRAVVQDAKPGDLLGPISTPSGLYVVQIVARGPRPFEGAEAELAAIWHERDPSAGEVLRLRQELRAKAKIERYPLNR
ncbi:MAG: peptidyl-prolyl cis-trans isomerase [Planctomycetes bacterium]|nr:peptidyl-prolyl cis-trans isomerase [Planctomycetota bacterium]